MKETVNFQSGVFSKISHELRTLLIGILGVVHFLEKTPLNSQKKEYLDVVIKSAKRLLTEEAKIGSF
jgi:signal transduction histidine kinase